MCGWFWCMGLVGQHGVSWGTWGFLCYMLFTVAHGVSWATKRFLGHMGYPVGELHGGSLGYLG